MSSVLALPSPHYRPLVYSFLLFRDRTWLCSFGRLKLTRQTSLAMNTVPLPVSHQRGINTSPPLPSIVLFIASFSWWSWVHFTTVGTCWVSISCTLFLSLYNSLIWNSLCIHPDWSLFDQQVFSHHRRPSRAVDEYLICDLTWKNSRELPSRVFFQTDPGGNQPIYLMCEIFWNFLTSCKSY